MNVMLIFDVIIVVFGAYMIFQGFGMKKKGEISSVLITPEEILKCKDKNGFISEMYWKEAVFGGAIIIVGILGLINDLVRELNVMNVIRVAGFLVMFVWFQTSLQKARGKFLY